MAGLPLIVHTVSSFFINYVHAVIHRVKNVVAIPKISAHAFHFPSFVCYITGGVHAQAYSGFAAVTAAMHAMPRSRESKRRERERARARGALQHPEVLVKSILNKNLCLK